MEYKDIKLGEGRRKKIIAIAYIGAIIFHALLFLSFNIKLVQYTEVSIPKLMKVKRVNIQQGNRPGQLSASSARHQGTPKPNMAPAGVDPGKTLGATGPKTSANMAPKKKGPSRARPDVNSRFKLPSATKKEEEKQEEQKNAPGSSEIVLDQTPGEYDVLSMVEDGEVIPGGGNMGDDPNAWGLTYDENTVFEYADEESKKKSKNTAVASVEPEQLLGTMATPIVQSEPPTAIEENFTKIPYPPEVKIKKENLQSGVCRVYLRVSINRFGKISSIYVRSPKTDEDKEKYKIFLEAVEKTVRTWTFEPKAADVFVDVRFTIE